jgi:hypothetical protein
MTTNINLKYFRLFKMYNMHGHPWSRILNPKKENKKESKIKIFYQKIIKPLFTKVYDKCSKLSLGQIWNTIKLVKAKGNDEIDPII